MGTYAHYMQPDRRIMVFNDPDFDPGQNATLIDTGDWLPRLILGRLASDTKLYVSFYKWKQADSFNPGLTKSEVYWADPGGIVHIQVISPRFKGWGAPFRALGLNVSNGAKLAKRLKEIARLTPYFTSVHANVKIVTTTETTEKDYDGMSIISRSYARKMGLRGYHKRVSFRYMDEGKFIKGDAIVVPDKHMIATHGELYDIVTADVNLKSEVYTKGWALATANPHHDHNQAMFDIQSASWLREWLYPRNEIKATLTHAVDEALESLRNGEWPKWMVLPETEAHGASVTDLPKVNENASDVFYRHHLRWQSYGMKLEHSASMLGMAAHSFKARLESKLNFRDHNDVWKPRMWLPLPHAVYGHIITHEALLLAGYTIPEGNEDKLFFHEESGSFSLPGDQFADTFEAHGTWDLDDSAKFFLRKDKKTGRVVCVIVRSPNSDGEYSIHEVDTTDFPLYHQYGEMPEIDLSKAPARIEHVMMHQQVAGLPVNSRVAAANFTKAEADYGIVVQSDNPGVGMLANAMMVYYASVGKSPAAVPATMGDMVDCVQQTPYQAGFAAITNFTQDLWVEITDYGKVDSYLNRTRVPPPPICGKMETYEGFFASLFAHFRIETKRFSEESRSIAFHTRAANPIPEIMAIRFDEDVMAEAIRWVNKAEEIFMNIMRLFPGKDGAARRAQENHKVVYQMVNTLANMDDERADQLVMAMYRFCVIPGVNPKQRYGISDRSLFAPAKAGEITVMEFFIRALIRLGVASEPHM